MKKLFLVDADYCPYAYGDRVDIEAIMCTDKWIMHLKDKLGEGIYLFFISGDNNFRYKVAHTRQYKANRKNKEKPKYYNDIRIHLLSSYSTLLISGAEADDGISLFANLYHDLFEVWIVSDDKDFGQIPCKQYRHSKNQILDVKHEIVNRQAAFTCVETGVITYIDYVEYYGDYMLYYQMLVGDNADNIPGVRGIGASNKIFKERFVPGITIAEAREIVWDEYQKAYGKDSVSIYLEQYMLLRLMRTNKNVTNEI